MACSECGSQTIAFAVPADYRVYVSSPGSSAADTASSESDADATGETELVAEFCPRCLTLEVSDEPHEPQPRSESTTADDDEIPAFSRVSDAFPTHRERAIPLALALGLSSSLATNRSAIEALLRDVERAGTDPLLVLYRLQRDPAVEPAIDLERRQQQLEQLLY